MGYEKVGQKAEEHKAEMEEVKYKPKTLENYLKEFKRYTASLKAVKDIERNLVTLKSKKAECQSELKSVKESKKSAKGNKRNYNKNIERKNKKIKKINLSIKYMKKTLRLAEPKKVKDLFKSFGKKINKKYKDAKKQGILDTLKYYMDKTRVQGIDFVKQAIKKLRKGVRTFSPKNLLRTMKKIVSNSRLYKRLIMRFKGQEISLDDVYQEAVEIEQNGGKKPRKKKEKTKKPERGEAETPDVEPNVEPAEEPTEENNQENQNAEKGKKKNRNTDFVPPVTPEEQEANKRKYKREKVNDWIKRNYPGIDLKDVKESLANEGRNILLRKHISEDVIDKMSQTRLIQEAIKEREQRAQTDQEQEV